MKEYLLAEFAVTCARALPDFQVLKSAARGGGLTLRKKVNQQLHLFIGVDPTPQRESAQLFVAWSRLATTPKFDDLQWAGIHERRGQNPEPQALFLAMDEGCLDATAFGAFTNAIQLEMWVPWPTIAKRLDADAKFCGSFRRVWGEVLTDAVLSGVADLPAHSMSWEQWFHFIDPAIPSDPSIETIMAPFVDEMNEQMHAYFMPFVTACERSSS
ncbi:MAG TPA: hypothetical protein VIN03_09125 [Roseateles sp.]